MARDSGMASMRPASSRASASARSPRTPIGNASSSRRQAGMTMITCQCLTNETHGPWAWRLPSSACALATGHTSGSSSRSRSWRARRGGWAATRSRRRWLVATSCLSSPTILEYDPRRALEASADFERDRVAVRDNALRQRAAKGTGSRTKGLLVATGFRTWRRAVVDASTGRCYTTVERRGEHR